MNKSSILSGFSIVECLGTGLNLPFFRHHQESLDQKSLHYLRTDALERGQGALMRNDELKHFNETLERLSLARRGRLGLQSNLGNDEWLRGNRRQSLGSGPEN